MLRLTLNIYENLTYINDTGFCCIAKESERFMKEALHEKSIEMDVKLNIPHFGVAQIQPAAHEPLILLPEFHGIHRCILLHFVSWNIRIFLAALLRVLPDAIFSQQSC